ncbi:MBOAT family O-acyltransferase [Hyunsoonleella pacifica]|uniref:MBOAT family protein n=1 Tax=Hyunsoonleella pacifica TaxID=1080224 RepID=A0A4V2JB74_9FLAO|nr:MBOAT family O-acyltransferase [Hyunsoonleella pacifica]TBN17668.1 MBOAT family protein [Hyunsoonleella pacifica]GGD10016.1 O-acyltransferase [Hyunsoonleella pacifica]
MLFNSIDFAIFLPIVFFIYWFVIQKNLKLQNLLIILASYVFYGWWDYRFLALIVFSSLLDYSIGIGLNKYNDKTKRKGLLILSLLVNLGFLGFFKYYNFFLDNFVDAFSFFGKDISAQGLNIILPVGISFYTFQTLSYTIDVYRKRLEPTKDIISFLAFVSFFPQLVAGPIERATNLLPQFYQKRKFVYSKAIDGMRQILWGLFKKVVVADNCAAFANQIFDNYSESSASTLFFGALFFTFQIYGDFSGYSDIAIGTSRLFGFNLMRNFAFPYFSRDIAEFWRRWHISLSTWFRDYVYIPLGGSRGGTAMKIRNTFIIFIVSGFWHGANWTFIIWGFLNALYFLPIMLMKKNRVNTNGVAEGRLFANYNEIGQIIFTFLLTMIAWVFFRAPSVTDAFLYLRGVLSITFFTIPVDFNDWLITFAFVIALVVIEWLQRDKEHALELFGTNIPKYMRWSFYVIIFFTIFWYGGSQQDFIYFQF